MTEDALPPDPTRMPRIPRPGRDLPPVPMALRGLLILMTGIELLLSGAEAGLFGHPDWRLVVFAFGAFHDPIFDGAYPPLYPGQGWIMLVSHSLLHGNLLHLLMNAVVLMALGKLLTRMVGVTRMLLTFLVSAIAGGIAFGLIAHTALPMIGASGAVFGFIGLWKYAELRVRRIGGYPMAPLWWSLVAVAFANALLWVVAEGGLAWEAHLGGFLAGWLLGWLWQPLSGPGEARPEALHG